MLDIQASVLYVVRMSDLTARTIRQPTLEWPDPEPALPREPELGECCGSGCAPCVFDLYQEALERYRALHAAWTRRQVRHDQ